MNRALRGEYLAAMNLESWVVRTQPPGAAALAAAAPGAAAAPVASGLDWPQLRERVAGCTRCALSATRTQTVFGVGNTQADWLIVGEAPGAEEDRQGEPFVGRAGQLLNSMLRAIGLSREQVFIANVLKCRPPGNRDPAPQEVPWHVPLDTDDEHAHYDTGEVADYFAAATQAALILAAYRAPYRGRSTPVNAWWGSFDLAVSLFSGASADPPSHDFIMRNAMDAQEVAIGWWPGDARHDQAAFYAYAHPAPADFSGMTLSPPSARWDGALGEYILDWDDVRAAADPHATGLEFARSAFRHACAVCGWDPQLAASADGTPPPVV